MSRVLYFRLGQKERPTFSAFLAMLRNIRGLLADFDAVLANDPRGYVRWEVEVLEKRSPPILGVIGYPIQRDRFAPIAIPQDFADKVEQELLDSTAKVSLQALRKPTVSDSALKRMRGLASTSRAVGDIAVYTETQEIPINAQTLHNIDKLTAPKTESHGSILGTLETISVHKANEIRVWDENSRRPVRCRYPEQLEETIKACLRERVLVSGIVSYNQFNQATAVRVSNIQRYPRADELPSIQDMSGLIDDVTAGASLAAYLEHLRDG